MQHLSSQPTSRTLTELRPGETATVMGYASDSKSVLRLLEMGFVAGTPLKIVRKGPFGSLLQVRLRGCDICLDSRLAQGIWVK